MSRVAKTTSLRKTLLLSLLLGTGAFFVALAQPPLVFHPIAYLRGQNDAARAIQRGEPRIAFLGRPAVSLGWLDPETGLLKRGLGCCVDDEKLAYLEAYNTEIRRALVAGELDGVTLKHKITTRAKALSRLDDEGISLPVGGRGVVVPGERFRLRLEQEEHANRPVGTSLHVTDLETKTTDHLFVCGRVKIAFRDNGTTAVLADDFSIRTIDLISLECLQGFPHP